MKIREMVELVAQRYSTGGPVSRQRDAAALGRIVESLDEDGARVYLERFVTKWRLFPREESSAARPQLVRRRPMPDLERRIYRALATGEPAPTPDAIEITVDGEVEPTAPRAPSPEAKGGSLPA